MSITSKTTTIRTSSSTGQYVQSAGEETAVDYRPKIANKSVLISRASAPGTRSSRSSFYSNSSMSGGRMSLNPAVYSQMAGIGIADFRGTREKEKREMQDCNDRLATYIEKVRWLEAQNKKLEAELEALRNRKQEDWKPIKDMYEGELNQARTVINDLSTQKGVTEGRLAGLQDEITSLREMIATYEANSKDYLKKIDQLNSQIGEYEGELTTLRMRVGSLEDELAKQRSLVQKYKDDNARLRSDLDAETAAHIEFEVLAQTNSEQCEFLQEVLDKLQVMQQEPVKVKGMDMELYFKAELRQAINGIREMYEDKMVQQCEDIERKYAVQVDQMRSGTVRDTMETEHAKSEVKRLKDLLSEKQSRTAELESQLAALKAERDNLAMTLSQLQLDMERDRAEWMRKLEEATAQVESMMVAIRELIDAKLSLELEIACYKKLLEGEENRTGLRELVEQSIGMQSSGGSQMASIISQSSSSSASGQLSQMIGQSSSAQSSQSSMSTSTARTTMKKTSTSIVGFQTVDITGGSIVLENTSYSKSMKMAKWSVVKREGGVKKWSVPLDKEIKAGGVITIFAKGVKDAAEADNEIVCEHFSFMPLAGEYTLEDDKGDVKATLTLKQN